MVNEPNFKDYSYYYDLINSDKDYQNKGNFNKI